MNGLVMKILRGKYLPTPLHYSPELRQVIHKLLSKAPEQRPTCEQLMEMVWVRETVMKFGSKVVQVRRRPARAGWAACPHALSNGWVCREGDCHFLFGQTKWV